MPETSKGKPTTPKEWADWLVEPRTDWCWAWFFVPLTAGALALGVLTNLSGGFALALAIVALTIALTTSLNQQGIGFAALATFLISIYVISTRISGIDNEGAGYLSAVAWAACLSLLVLVYRGINEKPVKPAWVLVFLVVLALCIGLAIFL